MNYSDREARDAALHAELESLRRMNQVIEGVIMSLDGARGNMAVSYTSSRPSSLPWPSPYYYHYLLPPQPPS